MRKTKNCKIKQCGHKLELYWTTKIGLQFFTYTKRNIQLRDCP